MKTHKPKTDDAWQVLANSGMSIREIQILQMREKRNGEISKQIGITTERVRQVRNKAMRKLFHPSRVGLAAAAGITPVVHPGCSDRNPLRE